MKRFFIIFISIICGFYLIFLLLPLILSPVMNSYSGQIVKMLEDSTGYKVNLEKIGVVTTPGFAVGIKADKISLSIPQGETFFSAGKASCKLALLPILAGKIQLDSISADSLSVNLSVRQDGHFLIEEYIPQPDPDKPAEKLQPLPLGIKLSNHLPNISIKNYDISFVDMFTQKKYSLSGKDLKISDFILDKKVKVSTNGSVTLDDLMQFNYNIRVFNKLMPDISLNEIVFNSAPAEEQSEQQQASIFNPIDIFKALRKTELSSDLDANVTVAGSFSSPEISGDVDLEKLSMLVDGKKAPDSHVRIKADGKHINTDICLYAGDKKVTSLIGKFTTGKNPKIDMQFKSNAEIDDVLRTINSFAKSFNYNDLETLRAKGSIDADMTLTSDMKKLKSSGYFKVPSASINYGLYGVSINEIMADVLFENMMNIKNISLKILGQPLKIYGTVQQNSDTDVHIIADKLLLKGIVAATGQVQLLKENIFNSGTLSMDASLKGRLEKIVPSVDISLNNIDIKNKPTDTGISLPNAKLIVKTEGKSFKGNLDLYSLNIVNPMASVSVPETKILIGDKDIDIVKSYLMLNKSRIDITGKISDYISEKINIDIKASGQILANDLKSIVPKDLVWLVSDYKGKIPLNVKIAGNGNSQDVSVNMTADSANYLTIFDVSELKGRKTIINSDIKLVDDSAKLANTGVYIDNITNPVAKLDGSVNKLSKTQNLALKLSIPNRVNMVIPGLPKSIMGIRGDIDITGTAMNPHLKGLVNIPEIKIPDMDVTITNMVANLNGPVMKGTGTVQTFKCGGIEAENLASEFLLKNYNVFYLNNLMGDAFNGKVSGNISYGLNDGKITVTMQGSDLNAVKAIEGLSGIKNALSGTLGFDLDVATRGATDVELMKYLTGKLTFNINNGKFMNVGRFDTLLYAQNILGNAILKAAVTSVTDTPIIQNTAEFKSIDGSMTFDNGYARINPIKVAGNLMSYYITGSYNLVNATTNVIILGRLDSKVVAVLGPLGDLTVDKLTSYIPKFGDLTAAIINAMTTDPEKEKTENIPALTSGSDSYKDFKVEFNGGVESKSSVKSFKWLSNCDVTPLNYKDEFSKQKENIKQDIKDFKQGIQDTKKEFQDAKQDVKNSIQDTKQQIQDAKQQLKDAKDELKNLFKF